MQIPIDSLSPETLRRVVAEYVTRDGTDSVDVDVKIKQVLRQLRAGHAALHFDEEDESTTIVKHDPREGTSSQG
ncbi:MAG: YheU family protein [Phycisphaeraceae bacterium]